MSLFDKKSALLLDLGGTLIEFEAEPWVELERRSMRLAYGFLAERGFELPNPDTFADEFIDFHTSKWPQIKEDNIEVSFDSICDEFLIGRGIQLDGDIRLFTEVFYAPISKQLQPISGGKDLLAMAGENNLKIGLVSNSPFPGEWHRREMERFGLLNSFDCTIFSSEFGMRKPHASIFEECLKQLEVEPGNAVHVGDRPLEDITGAQGAGITGVLLRRPDRDLPGNIKPDFIVDSLKDILNL